MEIALARVAVWVPGKELNLSGLNLTELPPLPPGLQELNCCENLLTRLPALPTGLQKLHCTGNRLTELPPLPSGLHSLFCDRNQLTELPPLPADLRTLACDNNQLTVLPSVYGLGLLRCVPNRFILEKKSDETFCSYMRRLCADAEVRAAKARVLSRTRIIKEELMMEMWAPWRLEKRLEAGEDLDDVLGL